MANSDQPYRIEQQSELYKLPKGADQIDWSSVKTDFFKLGKDRSFGEALKVALPLDKDMMLYGMDKTMKEFNFKLAAIEAKAVRAGLDIGLVRSGDRFKIDQGLLLVETHDQKKYFVKLDDGMATPLGFVQEGYSEARPEVVHATRRAWESLNRAIKHRVLSDVLAALTGGDWRVATFKMRKKIWAEMQKMDWRGMGVKLENYTGKTVEQQGAMIDFLAEKKDDYAVLQQLSEATGIKFLPAGKGKR